MATVHPSRMALVPQDSARSISPKRRDNRDRHEEREDGRGRGRDRHYESSRGERRASPKYEDYPRQGESMYPNRMDRDSGRDLPPHNGYSAPVPRGGGGADYMER